jgi:hypothetical protein
MEVRSALPVTIRHSCAQLACAPLVRCALTQHYPPPPLLPLPPSSGEQTPPRGPARRSSREMAPRPLPPSPSETSCSPPAAQGHQRGPAPREWQCCGRWGPAAAQRSGRSPPALRRRRAAEHQSLRSRVALVGGMLSPSCSPPALPLSPRAGWRTTTGWWCGSWQLRRGRCPSLGAVLKESTCPSVGPGC